MKHAVLSVLLIVLSSVARGDVASSGVAAYLRRDYRAALELLRPLASDGHAAAQGLLGTMYANGEGTARDYSQALKWYRLAAMQGHPYARFNLGVMYATGQGVSQDYREAEKWVRLAAEQGLPVAQFNLGMMYLKGDGVRRDEVKAYRWLSLAATQGDSQASSVLNRVEEDLSPEQIAEARRFIDAWTPR